MQFFRKLWAPSVAPVKLLTAGIVPHQIRNPLMKIILFDLAGHHEYYSSHCAILEAISLSPPTFLLLVNLLLDFNKITAQLHYWSAMIRDVCHKCSSSVIVVGTHADGIADKRQLESLGEAIERVAKVAIQKHTFVAFTSLNATAFHDGSVERFMSLLSQTNDTVISKYPAISRSSHVMYAFLNENVTGNQNAISLTQLQSLLEKEEPKVLPCEANEFVPLLKTLSDKGFIVLIDTPSDKWIVVHPEILLEKVNGVLFAPNSTFKEYASLASNTGVIPVELLKQHFLEPTYNIDLIVQFLIMFQLCVPVNLTNLDTNMKPEISPSTCCTNSGPLLFFPACVSVEIPTSVNPLPCGFGWQICITDANLFFSPRCLHVLISRLANSFSLQSIEPVLVPENKKYNRRCYVWKRGIYWMNREGIATLVEMKENFKCLSCVISTVDRNSLEYTSLVLSVIKVIKQACSEFCQSVLFVELITYPPEATLDHEPGTVELILLKEMIDLKKKTLTDSCGIRQVIISEWKKVEPQLLKLIEMKGLLSHKYD